MYSFNLIEKISLLMHIFRQHIGFGIEPSIFCSDFSYWRNKTCYDKKTMYGYHKSRWCATYKKEAQEEQNDTQNSKKLNCNQEFKGNNACHDENNNVGCEWDGGDCCGPNVKLFPCIQCQCLDPNYQGSKCKQDSYFCPSSKICIPKKWLCDGAVQCIRGDDEDFNLCKDTFPESATIKCLESNQTFYKIWIKATPCDGVTECKDGEDEDCDLKPPGLDYIIIACFVIVIFSAWSYRYCTLMHSSEEPPEIVSNDWNPEECKTFKGIKLIDLKVSKK